MKFPVKGYMLLPSTPVSPYRGIDRNPFLPLLTEDLLETNSPVDGTGFVDHIWPFCPPGWRRDAFRLYEENLVCNLECDAALLQDKKVAQDIKLIIEPRIGHHEIVMCEISETSSSNQSICEQGIFLGLDIAYFGGDYFSAIRAGLFGSPWFYGKPNPRLSFEFGTILNEYGLFSDTDPIKQFIGRFIEEAPCEGNADFYIWSLTLC